MKFLGSWLKSLLEAFFPFRCHACKKCCDFGVVLCDDCKRKLKGVISEPKLVSDTISDFDIYTMSSYDSFAADMVKIIKYKPSKKLAKVLGKMCAEQGGLKSFLRPDDVLVPVPMHKKRLDERGFNQAAVIAEQYAEAAGCHLSPAIVRSRFTKPQASCDETERMHNLENAFALNPDIERSAFIGKRFILIDDVATTGTTLEKCSAPLKSLGASEIIALVVAHSYKHNS